MEIGQVHNLKPVVGDRGAVQNADILSRERLGRLGGTEEKWRDIINIEDRPVELIERHPDEASVPERGKADPIGFTKERINILNESGLPTPVFYEGEIGGQSVLLAENVTVIGGAVYGKSTLERVSQGKILPIDEKFVEVVERNTRSVFGMDDPDAPNGSLWSWLMHANSEGVLLPADDAMELVIDPDGKFRWMVLDPAGVARAEELNLDPMDLANANIISTKDVFIDVYQTLYKTIKERIGK